MNNGDKSFLVFGVEWEKFAEENRKARVEKLLMVFWLNPSIVTAFFPWI